MNDVTLRKLEFETIREVLAGCCATGLGKRLAHALTPSQRPSIVRDWLTQVRELSAMMEKVGLPPMGGVHDIRDYIRASAFPTPLEPDPLAKIADTLFATGELCRWFHGLGDGAASLRSLKEQIQDFTAIADSIREAIDSRGKVRDDASDRLLQIRRAIDHARDRIRGVFDRLLRQTHLTRMLQYSGTTFHDDRMVLPLKAEQRGRIPGIVHRTSDSGATLFVEPAESVELNNSIVQLKDEESKEITRILHLLTQKVQANARGIMLTLRAVGVLDLIAGKCRYAQSRFCLCPDITEDGVLELHKARHPVLMEIFDREAKVAATKREVVAIDVRLGQDFDVLVITGPNTGGKTVALKCIGLLAVMTQCGIPIPVGEGSRMPVYDSIFIDIGDEQSLQQSLSTFSSHLSNQLEILRQSGGKTLVLIDELGAGTDPDEGAAIGQAIVRELLHLRARAIVTTHLSALKSTAFTHDRVDNGSVEFDPQTLKPTFHLRLGEPGNSNALIIAKRLGMPARLVQMAKGYLARGTRALNRAIEGTIDSRREAEAARKVALDASLHAQREREGFEKRLAELDTERKNFEQWTQWIAALAPGDEVFVKPMQRTGKVVRMELHKQRALVLAGSMHLEVPLRDLSASADTV